ncbi:thioesterase [Marinobacterium nitratireducens]|uniref:Thioesterase n=1 Tax=Marinobacterium nitratireducens TaxID=518897 RepID=A0A918DR77_9GAMM|nr:YiiD C-terminal domain-containing protein [Marinobacterium nitratireducens]GGO79768.1 thioesterase [Marinobacterium nitratireducens]
MSRVDIAEFRSWLLGQIPLLGHMGLGDFVWDGRRLEIPALLAPNVNDKGTGFGGSQATLATICGWSLITLLLREQGLECDLVIADSQLDYRAPVDGDFCACTELPDSQAVDAFFKRLHDRGRAPLPLCIEVRQGGRVAMRMQGRYVAIKRVNG